jgi:hypothetical protein
MTKPHGPNNYASFADFEREEIHPFQKLGWSLDDLEQEAMYRPGSEDSGESTTDELDFG